MLSRPGPGEPITTEEAARFFLPLEAARGLLLAVSGGPDSTALMLLAAAWGGQAGRPPISVATVDHGLRLGSRDEAETVGRWARALGLAHGVLTWQGAKPRTRLHERARKARYALLATHATEAHASHIVVAHHADDQAETVLFRLIRGSSLGGLGGMAPFTDLDGLTLARPFLDVPKTRLMATLRAAAQPSFDDPSNADERFARARLRRLMPLLADEGLDRDALLRLAGRAARVEDALQRLAADRLDGLQTSGATGGAALDVRPLASAPPEIVLRVVRSLISEIKPEGAAVRLDRLEELIGRLLPALRAGKPFKGTLAGTILTLDAQGKVTIEPETGRHRGRSC